MGGPLRLTGPTTCPPPPCAAAVSLAGDWSVLKRLVGVVTSWDALVAAVPLERQGHMQVGGRGVG